MAWAEVISKSPIRDTLPTDGRMLSYAEALNEALDLAMGVDKGVVVLGQGVDDPAATFGVTKGLQQKHGEKRVFDVPLSEEGMTGIITGAAMGGLRPFMTHNRPDFFLLTMNQLVTHAAKICWLDEGRHSVPFVIWAATGRGWGSGAQHSQSVQGLLIGIPGLKIVTPSTPHDAKGLLLSALADPNPVVVLEHRLVMRQKGFVPEGFYTIPFGKGAYRRKGTDLTIVGISHALDLATQAIDQLSDSGVTADVIDLRTLKPLDEEIIFESVEKTGKLLVVDTGWAIGGVCAEIGCLVAEKRFSALKAPICRIGMPDVPTPAGYTLEQHFYPDVDRIKAVIRKMTS